KLSACRNQRFRYLSALFERGCIKRRSDFLQLFVERIQQHHSVLAKQPCHDFRKRFGKAGAWSVTLAQVGFDSFSELRAWKIRDQHVNRPRDAVAELYAADRGIRLVTLGLVLDAHQFPVLIQPRAVAHFLIIVIFACDPEPRNRLDALLAETTGKLDYGERFVDRIQRSSEQSRLLTGHDRHRTGPAKHIDVLERKVW